MKQIMDVMVPHNTKKIADQGRDCVPHVRMKVLKRIMEQITDVASVAVEWTVENHSGQS